MTFIYNIIIILFSSLLLLYWLSPPWKTPISLIRLLVLGYDMLFSHGLTLWNSLKMNNVQQTFPVASKCLRIIFRIQKIYVANKSINWCRNVMIMPISPISLMLTVLPPPWICSCCPIWKMSFLCCLFKYYLFIKCPAKLSYLPDHSAYINISWCISIFLLNATICYLACLHVALLVIVFLLYLFYPYA